MSSPLLVIAGTYSQYRHYCSEHRLDPRRHARYVRNIHDVRGLGDSIRYVRYGTWEGRGRELRDVFAYLEHRGATEVGSHVPDGPVLLGDVLTADELAAQPFASDTVLDGPWMPDEIRACFKAMPDEAKRTYVRHAVDLASLARRHPGECLALLLIQAYAPPPRIQIPDNTPKES